MKINLFTKAIFISMLFLAHDTKADDVNEIICKNNAEKGSIFACKTFLDQESGVFHVKIYNVSGDEYFIQSEDEASLIYAIDTKENKLIYTNYGDEVWRGDLFKFKFVSLPATRKSVFYSKTIHPIEDSKRTVSFKYNIKNINNHNKFKINYSIHLCVRKISSDSKFESLLVKGVFEKNK